MASTGYLDYIDYNGYRYAVGDIVTINNTTVYTNSYQSESVTNSAYASCTFKITKIADQSSSYWNGSSYYPLNPIEVTVYSGNATIVGTSGCLRVSQLASGGTGISYTVTLNKNGGTGGTDSVTIVYGTAKGSYPSITLPTRNGYTFNGYYTAKSGGTQYYDSVGNGLRAWDIASNTTLYAQWAVNSGILVVDPNGGVWNGSESTQSFSKDFGASMTMIAPTRTGYTFDAWYTKSSPKTTNFGTTVNTDNLVIPRFRFAKISSSVIEVMVYAPDAASVKVPTWTIDPEGGGQDDIQWYSLTSGSWSRDGVEYNWGKQISIANHNYELQGYTAHVYAYDSDSTQIGKVSALSAVDIPVLGDQEYYFGTYGYTLYAKWTANKYTVTLDPNDGVASSNGSEVTAIYGTNDYWKINSFCPTRDGYVFKGFYNQVSGGECVYDENGEAIDGTYWDGSGENATWKYPDNVTLYARWEVLNVAYFKSEDTYELHNSYCKFEDGWDKAIPYIKVNDKYERSTV